MNVTEFQTQAKQLSYLEQVELVRFLSADLCFAAANRDQKNLSWFGIGESEITDLSERDEELLFKMTQKEDAARVSVK